MLVGFGVYWRTGSLSYAPKEPVGRMLDMGTVGRTDLSACSFFYTPFGVVAIVRSVMQGSRVAGQRTP